MGDNSAIEWTDATWTPIRSALPGTAYQTTAGKYNLDIVTRHLPRWGCQKVSPGCDNCYASRLNAQHGGPEYPVENTSADLRMDVWNLALNKKALSQPLHWKKPRKVFVCSMTDLFGEWVPDEWIDQVFAVMAGAPQHTFQILTKRAKRMRDYLLAHGREEAISAQVCGQQMLNRCPAYGCSEDCEMDGFAWPLPNVWVGVSVESQAFAWRLNYLAQTPAAVRFVSAEPLLGPLNIGRWMQPAIAPFGRLDWVISGGESGHGHRPMDPAWVRAIHEQCAATGVAHLHKQNGGRTPKAGGRLVDGQLWDAYPQVAV